MQSIYVGNVSWNMTGEQLQEVFEKIGAVTSSRIITDRETGRSRGFGFVEMSKDDADRAVSELDGQEIDGRNLKVNLAEDRRNNSNTTRNTNTARNSNSYDNNYNTGLDTDSNSNYGGGSEYTKPRNKKNWGKDSY